MLMNGRSIHCVNSRSSYMMAIRIVISSNVGAKSKESGKTQERGCGSPVSEDLK